MNRDEALNTVLSFEPDFLPLAPKKANGRPTYICPECGNGSGQDGDGIALDISSKDQQHKHWKCFKCGLYEDVAGLWKRENHYSNDYEAFSALFEHYGLQVEGGYSAPKSDRSNTNQNQQQQDGKPNQAQKTAYIEYCAKHITDCPYPIGVTMDTLKKYNVGYDSAHYIGKDENKWKTAPCLIVPVGIGDYAVIHAETKERISATGAHIFGFSLIGKNNNPVFVTDNEIDAIAITDAGGQSITIAVPDNVDYLKGKRLSQAFIGSKAPVMDRLKELGALCCTFDAFTGAKGAADYSRLYTLEQLKNAVATAQQIAEDSAEQARENLLSEYQAETSARGHLNDFLKSAATDTPPIETSFPVLDKVLEGGLFEGLYVIGAISSLGKTAFVMQMCDQIAQRGKDVLIFSLEMSTNELIARSVSRHSLQRVFGDRTGTYTQKDAKTSKGITVHSRYKNYNARERRLIAESITDYQTYAEHVYIIEGIGNINADSIRTAAERHRNITGTAPVIVVDYVQILAPILERATDKQNMDKNILELKRLSRDLHAPVIGISSFNRDNYSVPVSMAAFKESGAIEYSSDVLIGLQLTGVGSGGFSVDAAKSADPRNIDLVILKNRSGRTGVTITYSYYQMFNCFVEDFQ